MHCVIALHRSRVWSRIQDSWWRGIGTSKTWWILVWQLDHLLTISGRFVQSYSLCYTNY